MGHLIVKNFWSHAGALATPTLRGYQRLITCDDIRSPSPFIRGVEANGGKGEQLEGGDSALGRPRPETKESRIVSVSYPEQEKKAGDCVDWLTLLPALGLAKLRKTKKTILKLVSYQDQVQTKITSRVSRSAFHIDLSTSSQQARRRNKPYNLHLVGSNKVLTTTRH